MSVSLGNGVIERRDSTAMLLLPIKWRLPAILIGFELNHGLTPLLIIEIDTLRLGIKVTASGHWTSAQKRIKVQDDGTLNYRDGGRCHKRTDCGWSWRKGLKLFGSQCMRPCYLGCAYLSRTQFRIRLRFGLEGDTVPACKKPFNYYDDEIII